jgi:maltooligosyltrehalose trehalohydrolase
MKAAEPLDFAVWAPDAGQVTLHLPGREHVMARQHAGWWRLTMPAAAETSYAFSVDGGPPRPDPRGLRLPDGPHGWSRRFDPAAFAWTDQTWHGVDLADAVLYELHVGTFTPDGTLDAAAARLDHLAELGVTLVELLPLAPFPGRRGWGYDGVAPFAVHEA